MCYIHLKFFIFWHKGIYAYCLTQAYSLHPKKTNLVLNIMFSSTTNLDMIMSRYVIVENV